MSPSNLRPAPWTYETVWTVSQSLLNLHTHLLHAQWVVGCVCSLSLLEQPSYRINIFRYTTSTTAVRPQQHLPVGSRYTTWFFALKFQGNVSDWMCGQCDKWGPNMGLNIFFKQHSANFNSVFANEQVWLKTTCVCRNSLSLRRDYRI